MPTYRLNAALIVLTGPSVEFQCATLGSRIAHPQRLTEFPLVAQTRDFRRNHVISDLNKATTLPLQLQGLARHSRWIVLAHLSIALTAGRRDSAPRLLTPVWLQVY